MNIFAADRQRDESRRTYIEPRYYAARITYVGSEVTGDLGTIRGEFMTQAEYEARAD